MKSGGLLNIIENSPPYIQLLSQLNQPGGVVISGLQGSMTSLVIAALSAKVNITAAVSDMERAESLLDDLYFLAGAEEVCFLPAEANVFRRSMSPDTVKHHRAETFKKFALQPPRILVIVPETLLEKFPPISLLKANTLRFKLGSIVEPMELLKKLMNAGFRREVQVESCGEAALRGGILDIFPYSFKAPVRLEFWGDEITSIRQFDPRSQISVKKLNSIDLLLIRQSSGSANIFNLYNGIVFWDDLDSIGRNLNRLSGDDIDPRELNADSAPCIVHNPLGGGIDFHSASAERLSASVTAFKDITDTYFKKDYRVIAGAESSIRMEKVEEFLADYDSNGRKSIETGILPLQSGFVFHPGKLVFYSERELFDYPNPRRSFARFRTYSHPVEPSALKSGDFVVHEDFGIGIYQGLKNIKVAGHERECLYIKYRDDVSLYVRLEAFAKVQKYSGREGFIPPVSKIGGADWQRLRKKTKKALLDMARELLKLQAVRTLKEGFAHERDNVWQKEMEDSFAYEDTIDQARAVDEIKRDMEDNRPMDRLLLGDVGFGKTEVAIRAAFKAVVSGKQAAVLAPTTILVQQHYHTFKARMAKYPILIESLSRFRTPKEQKKVIADLQAGKIDIIIGTHRLLSKDVKFKNLGLLVIDEEHRFGVRHKERLKELRAEVDILTLTATPIPRTLHMALMGTRNLSKIETAPLDRLPVYTEVSAFDKGLIREAVLQELSRGGQVYFVHNRVRSIESVRRMLRRIAPEARYGVAHGQMPSKMLEQVMMDFLDKRFDILICTNIIESGLDLPNVNTMIINRADQMGLAQLYQLRGRIGRSSRQAYAYLLIPPKITLSREARKRLETISQFTDLGSGFQVALRDLEIRGAGNLLGSEQSGFINSIGFELYSAMLEEAVREMKAELNIQDDSDNGAINKKAKDSIKFNFAGDAYIPQNYIQEEELRVNFYRKLNICGTKKDFSKLEFEMADRFGVLPIPVKNLSNLLKLKILAVEAGALFFDLKRESLRLEFASGEFQEREFIIKAVEASRENRLEFDSGPPLGLILHFDPGEEWEVKFAAALNFLSRLKFKEVPAV
ncbi:MAG: transcription-repair coupling factor [FCB group bacterium]|nr:transcription-repair coupling factor [FCB group bacterium]